MSSREGVAALTDDNDKDEEEETEEIIVLIFPDGRENEEQFDEHGTKWKNA